MHQLGTKPVGFLVREMVGLSCTQAAFWSCPNVKRHVDGFSRWGLLAEVSVNPRPNYAYLRDLVDTTRAYESPARYLNYLTVRDKDGTWHRSRAVTLAVQCAKASRSHNSVRLLRDPPRGIELRFGRSSSRSAGSTVWQNAPGDPVIVRFDRGIFFGAEHGQHFILSGKLKQIVAMTRVRSQGLNSHGIYAVNLPD
jgi:hypothetical protein